MAIRELSAAQSSPGPSSTEHVSCALHEVSNALTVVLGWLQMAQDAPTPEDARQAIGIALDHARRGRIIARQAIGAEVGAIEQSRCASELAQFAGQSVEPQAHQRRIKIVVQAEAGSDRRIEGEGDALQVLTNLLLNAVDFSPEGGRVCLRVSREADSLLFEVSDDGPGVPLRIMGDIFDAGVTTRDQGAGIGLPFSRRLARRNGGDLSLANPGEPGAQFQLRWPCAVTSYVPPARGTHAELAGSRILMIEDDHSIAQLVQLSLEARGAEIVTILDPEALDDVLGSSLVFDLALLDLSPIKARLHEILSRLAHLSPAAPLVLMSGEPAGVDEELEKYFSTSVRKPFDMDQLLETVDRCLAGVKAKRVASS